MNLFMQSLVPHAEGGLVVVVTVELGHAQHGLGENGQKAHCFHKGVVLDQKVHEEAPNEDKAHCAFQVRLEIGPLPKIVWIKI